MYKLSLFKNSITLLVTLLITISSASCSPNKIYEEAHFIHYNTSFYAEKGSEYTLVITYLLKKNSNDYLDPTVVESINFKNSKNVQIKNFSFFNSESTGKYDVKNIEMVLSFNNLGIERLSEIEINFKNRSSKNYTIGNWYFNVENKDSIDKSPIEMGEDYAIISSFFDGYLVNLVNKSSEKVLLNEVHINLDDVLMESTKLEFDLSGKLKSKIEANIDNPSYKFYVIRPKVSYTYEGKKHSYYPHASLYGVINLTENDFDKEYLKTTQHETQ
ncbi:hypothetical protein AB4Z45_03440 [Paenibacillus sp. MCAF9]|uniref:hypothetical protein n=1 Tax=Paenibacillus sp. MCAF9 TaxID=3233046 RepID=UPI003F9A0254